MQDVKIPYSPELKVPFRSLISNTVLLAASVGLVVASVQFIQTKMTSVTSVDAVINGALTDIKAVQKGVVLDLAIKTGDSVVQGHTLFKLKNDRVSKLSVEQLTGQLQDQQVQLAQAEESLSQLLSMRDALFSDRKQRTQLDIREAQKALDQAESDLKEEKALYKLAKTNRQRFTELWAERAIARLDLDRYTGEVEQRQARIEALEARIAAFRNAAQATELGYRPLSNSYDPTARKQDLELRILDQRRAVRVLAQSIRSTQTQIKATQADVSRNQSVSIKAPSNGVVWQVTAQPNKFVQEGESVGQILDCDKRWVDVFVDESALKSIHPGTPARIELYGTESRTFQGKVSLIRSGMGRLTAGQDVAVPIPQNMPRMTQVRVELNPDGTKSESDVMCYVGYTGKVFLKIQ